MHIVFLTDDFPPNSFGGAGIIAAELARGIRKAGHNITIITTREQRSQADFYFFEDIPVYAIYAPYPSRLTSYFCLYNPSAVKQIKSLLTRIRPDIVHAHNIHQTISYHSLLISKKCARKVFLTAHDTMLFSYGKFSDYYDKNNLSIQSEFNYKISTRTQLTSAKKRFNPFRNFIIRYYVGRINRVFAITERLKAALNSNGFNNVTVSHYGLDPVEWAPNDAKILQFKQRFNLVQKQIVLFGGRLSSGKGGDVTISAFAFVVKSLPVAKLLIVGKLSPYTKHLQARAKELNIEKNIIFTGWLNREEMKCAIHASDVCVTPSIYFDAFNLFNLEAMISKKPVIGTCFGGTPEIVVDGKTGIIINPNNTRMFAEAIQEILTDENSSKKMGIAGYSRVQKYFLLNHFVEQTLDHYESL